MGRKIMREFIKAEGAHGSHTWNENRVFLQQVECSVGQPMSHLRVVHPTGSPRSRESARAQRGGLLSDALSSSGEAFAASPSSSAASRV